MQFTFALIAEKVLEILDCSPVFLHSVPQTEVNYIATYHRHSTLFPSCIYLIDNSKGTRPLTALRGIQHGILIASPMEYSPDFSKEEYYQTWMGAQNPSASLLVLPPTVSHRQVEKAAMQAFSFYNIWGERILQQIRVHGDWFSFIDLAHDILQNPMLIYDNSMKVLAYTRNDGTSDALWTDTVAAKTAYTNSAEESMELLKYIRKMDQSQKPFRHFGKGMSDPFYSCNIMSNGRRIGMVTETEHNHPVTQGHQDLLWIFAGLLSIQMQQEYAQQQSAGLANHQLISDLMDGSISSTGLLTTRLAAARWQPLSVIHLLRFESAIPYISDTQWREGLDALSMLPMHGIGCLFPNQLLYICTTDTADIPVSLLEGLHHICQKYQFRLGISDPFSHLLDTKAFRNQPAFALSLSTDEICFYKDVRFFHLKKHLSSHETPKDLIHPAILRLKELDKSSGSQYLKTLRALFDNQYSQVGAALTLGIHRTTLFYRLQKIEELTGIRMTDAGEMLHLQISFLMLEEDTHT